MSPEACCRLWHLPDLVRVIMSSCVKMSDDAPAPADIVEIKHIMLPPSPREFKDIYVVFELMETDLHQVTCSSGLPASAEPGLHRLPVV